MKHNALIKKIIISFISVFLVALTVVQVNPVLALNNKDIEVYAFEETYTIQADKTLINNYGYVTCKVGITYNSVGKTYKVSWFECDPHLSSSFSFLKFGGASVDPGVGKLVTGSYVTVSFNVGNGAVADARRYSVNIYL